MKKNILVLLLPLVIFACSTKKDNITPNNNNSSTTQPPVENTSLEITVKNNFGNTLSNASVKLYRTITDWKNENNQIGETHYSGSDGVVKFNNLTDSKYYWLAEKDCYNNRNGAQTTVDNLTKNANNTIDVITSPTGTLKFTSNSSNPYYIYINGDFALELEGHGTHFIPYAPTGNYSIRVLQKSGYAMYPTDMTYSGTLECNGTSTTIFPN